MLSQESAEEEAADERGQHGRVDGKVIGRVVDAGEPEEHGGEGDDGPAQRGQETGERVAGAGDSGADEGVVEASCEDACTEELEEDGEGVELGRAVHGPEVSVGQVSLEDAIGAVEGEELVVGAEFSVEGDELDEEREEEEAAESEGGAKLRPNRALEPGFERGDGFGDRSVRTDSSARRAWMGPAWRGWRRGRR